MSEYPTYLIHYGIEGQKWGVKRFQNEDGTYTTEGLQRRREALQNGASKEELKRINEVAKRELIYNKNMTKKQNSINKKFDKLTEKIKSDKEAGKEINDRKINKAIKLGTEFRKLDYIAGNPSFYYDKRDEVTDYAKKAGRFGLLGLPLVAIKDSSANKKINKYYEKVFEQAKNESIADLEKHGIKAKSEDLKRQSRVKSLLAAGHTQSEVAKLMGAPKSTANKHKQ